MPVGAPWLVLLRHLVFDAVKTSVSSAISRVPVLNGVTPTWKFNRRMAPLITDLGSRILILSPPFNMPPDCSGMLKLSPSIVAEVSFSN